MSEEDAMFARFALTHLHIRESADAVHITLVGCRRLDEQTLERVREELLALADELGACHVFLSLAQVGYMASAGLGLLLTLKKKLDQSGGQLVIWGINPLVRELFEITRLTEYFHILETADI